MDFFDKLVDTFNSTSKEISKKAKTFSSTAKLQSQISAEQQKINDTFAQIGKAYFEANKDSETAEYADCCKQIIASRELIEKLKVEVEVLKGLQRCPNCGEAVSLENKFCPKCGARMPEVAVEPVEPEETEEKTEE